MASTTNMLILAFLLQDNEILQCTASEEAQEINSISPLNHYTTGDPIRAFIYDLDEHIICYANPENPVIQTPEYQEILTQEPYLSFIGIEVYLA